MIANEDEIDLETIAYLLTEHCNFDVSVKSDSSLIVSTDQHEIDVEINIETKDIELVYITPLADYRENDEMQFLTMINLANQKTWKVKSVLGILPPPVTRCIGWSDMI